MKEITLQQYVHAIERVKVLLDQVDTNTPYNSPKMIELMEQAKIVESYEDVYVKLPEPKMLDKIQFYFEQRFKYGQQQNIGKDKAEIPFFDDHDLADFRSIVNDFDSEEWNWYGTQENDDLDKIKELIGRVENESFEFNYSAEEIRRVNQRDVYADHNEELMLDREFFKRYANEFLPKLVKSSPKGVKKIITEIRKKRDLFTKSHMAYKGFVGTIEYSKEDNVYFGKILNTSDLVLYEADKKEQIRASFYEAVEHHIHTND